MNRHSLPNPATFLPWLVSALSLLWLKRDLLIAFPLHQVLLTATPTTVHFYNQMACYRADIPLLFGVVPLLLTLPFYFMPPSWRLALLTTVCALLEILIYAEGRSLLLVGQFSSLSMFRSAISWGGNGSGARDYLPLSGLIKLVLAIAVVLASALGAYFLTRRNSPGNSARGKKVVAGYFAAILLASVACWAVPAPASPMKTSVATILGESFLGLDTVENHTRGLQALSKEDLLARYRQLAQAPVTDKDPTYWGKAKDQNVIFIILETAPARYLDLTGDMSDFPNMARLTQHSLIGTRHYSTYPYTNRAHLSIFTSLYPYASKNFQSFPHQKLPGVIAALADQGYLTRVYGHLWTGETDANMYKSIGFDEYVVPPGGLDSGNVAWRQKITIDYGALKMLESDIASFHQDGKKFAVAFLPNVGHGPWPDMTDDGNRQTIPQRGHGLMKLQDAWIGELIQVLEKNRMLDNTMIVVTGDHGARDKVDDPDFTIGLIDDYSYHVPLLIYSPALPTRTDIPWITSHVDIAPTILDLLGVENGRKMEEGAPIWQEDLRNRTTFFLASHYMGADGYYQNKNYFMVKYLSDEVLESPELHFEGQPLAGTAADQVKETTNDLNALQAAMFYRYAFDKN